AQQHLGDAGNLGTRIGRALGVLAGDEQVDVAADLAGGGDGVERGRLDRRVVVLGQQQDRHQITFASLRSLSTSSLTLFTFTPDLRLAGSTTFSVFTRGATSTPSASGFSCSIGFFLAFMMLGSEAQRGSFNRRSVVIRAGVFSLTTTSPASTSRVTVKPPSSIGSLEAKVACGQPSRPASIWPVWLQSSSIACLPRMTSPGCSLAMTAFSSLATASGCSSTSVSTWMPRSAPMARAVRMVSWLDWAPQETATISVALPASFSRMASSTAISQNGFMAILTLAVSTPVPSALTRTLTLASMTRLTATSTFMAGLDLLSSRGFCRKRTKAPRAPGISRSPPFAVAQYGDDTPGSTAPAPALQDAAPSSGAAT